MFSRIKVSLFAEPLKLLSRSLKSANSASFQRIEIFHITKFQMDLKKFLLTVNDGCLEFIHWSSSFPGFPGLFSLGREPWCDLDQDSPVLRWTLSVSKPKPLLVGGSSLSAHLFATCLPVSFSQMLRLPFNNDWFLALEPWLQASVIFSLQAVDISRKKGYLDQNRWLYSILIATG